MAKKGQTKANAKARTVRERAYDGSAKRKKDRAARNKARRKAIREGRAKVGDNTAVDHIKPLSKGGSRDGATRVTSRKQSDRQGGKLGSKKRKR